MILKNKVVLITGGTGSFGRKFTETILKKHSPRKVIIFSRDEFKQYEMAKKFSQPKFNIRYFLGDIRDRARLEMAFKGVDYVIHAAALKQVPALEYNPIEAVKTNVTGADNIVEAAINSGVEKVIALSTDKAVNPINLYGATKLVAEKIFIAANAFAGNKVKFSVVRYGNVVGSRGSVIEYFLKLKKEGLKQFPVTDVRMTRFWMTLEESVDLVLKALEEAAGGEIFVPKIPSMKITDLARAVEPDCGFKVIGIRPGEKMHELLISGDDNRHTKLFKGLYVVLPQFYEQKIIHKKYDAYPVLKDSFVYSSDRNDSWLTRRQLEKIIKGL